MTGKNVIQLLLLAAIWGGSFLFMRIAAPEIAAVWLSELRVIFAAVTLLLVSVYIKRSVQLKRYWCHYLIIGGINSALPFLLFSYAASSLSVSALAIINATSPIWGVCFIALKERQRIARKTALGLSLGVLGVVILVGFDAELLRQEMRLPILAALLATVCYGLASTYARYAQQVEAFNNAHGSMWGAVVVLLPLLYFSEPAKTVINVNLDVWLAIVVLGVLCTAIAYLLYFKLINDIGPASALCVTFLIPVFGILWGNLFLAEQLSWQLLLGGGITVLGTMLVTGFSPRKLLRRRTHVV